MKWASCCAARSASSLPDKSWIEANPLCGWADAQLLALTQASGSNVHTQLSGAALLGERAVINGFSKPGRVSAGGGCQIYDCADGHVALNLSRSEDREMLPALFGVHTVSDIAQAMKTVRATDIVTQGRTLGLAIAALDERPISPACQMTATGPCTTRDETPPRVLDLSALWAGPLAARLFLAGGATVTKVESANRPDALRTGDPEFYARLNKGKEEVAIDLKSSGGRAQLLRLIAKSDIVIEAARPRALLQMGIDADALVAEQDGHVWITITGHGVSGDAANWVGFGDDAGVAAGLSAALLQTTGEVGFVGDAIADPLTGIFAARLGFELYRAGQSARMMVSMSNVVRQAMDFEGSTLPEMLRKWAASC